MFTAEQILSASAKVTSGAEYPLFVRALSQMGVVTYEHMVGNGSTKYIGAHQYEVIIAPQKMAPLTINATSHAAKLRTALVAHQQGQTDYPTFCQQAADAGVEKWICDIQQLTICYVDTLCNCLLEESIPAI